MSRHRAHTISDSSARGLRTVYQSAVGLIGLVPSIVVIFAAIPSDTPGYAQIMVIMANVIVWTSVASKIINALEDKGIIPAPWKTVSEPHGVHSKGVTNDRRAEAQGDTEDEGKAGGGGDHAAGAGGGNPAHV